jgi:acetyl-CoA synthetase
MDATDVMLARVADWLAEYGGDSVDVAELLCDRHAGDPERLAAISEDAAGNTTRLTFAQLREESSRFAGVLQDLGVGHGDPVAVLLPKTPELLIAVLGIWRLGAVYVPLFTAFGPVAITYRLQHSDTRVIVTDAANRPKISDADAAHRTIVEVEHGDDPTVSEGAVRFWQSLATTAPLSQSTKFGSADPMILIYTSGTTGLPKGVAVPVRALAAFQTYMHFGMDVREDDAFWNIADPGWAYGLYYGVVGPLLLGQTILLVNAPFSAELVWRIWETHGVTNFAAAPTVYRALRAAEAPSAARERLRLRVASSAGEPLNPDVMSWAATALGVPLHDQYGQTEHGMVVNNHHQPALRRPVRAGSMGGAMPGFRVAILDQDEREAAPGEIGQLAIDVARSPLFWFDGYFEAPDETARRFTADRRYYLTGDSASADEDGYITFTGRDDDLINSAGYRIGPFEVESVLIAHPTVAEAAVVAAPDALRGEVVTAFVVLRPGVVANDDVAEELKRFVKRQLAAHAFPRDVHFLDALPKTPSGKIQRFLLRQQSGAVS